MIFSFFYGFSKLYCLRILGSPQDFKLIIASGIKLPACCKGTQVVDKNIPILILAGHAGSQWFAVAGTSGEAVDKFLQIQWILKLVINFFGI